MMTLTEVTMNALEVVKSQFKKMFENEITRYNEEFNSFATKNNLIILSKVNPIKEKLEVGKNHVIKLSAHLISAKTEDLLYSFDYLVTFKIVRIKKWDFDLLYPKYQKFLNFKPLCAYGTPISGELTNVVIHNLPILKNKEDFESHKEKLEKFFVEDFGRVSPSNLNQEILDKVKEDYDKSE